MKKTFAILLITFLMMALIGCTAFEKDNVGEAIEKVSEMKKKADKVNKDVAGKVIEVLTERNTPEYEEEAPTQEE